MPDWNKVREEFSCTKTMIRFDHGSIAFPPDRAIYAYTHQQYIQHEITTSSGFENAKRLVEETRKKIAKLLNAKPNEIILPTNATEGANRVAHMLDLKPNDEIIVASYYGSIPRQFTSMAAELIDKIYLNPHAKDFLEAIAMKHDTKTILINIPRELSDKEFIKAVKSAISDKTRIILIDQVLRQDGRIMPVKDICKIAREKGIYTLVDGAQAMGNLHPRSTDVKEMDCDFYISSGHKFLLGGTGIPAAPSGILYVREGLSHLLKRLARPTFTPFELPLKHENNILKIIAKNLQKSDGKERNIDDLRTSFIDYNPFHLPSLASLKASLDLLDEIGHDNIEKRVLELRQKLIDELKSIPNITIHSSSNPSPGIVSFSIKGKPSREIVEELEKKGIITNHIVDPDSVRICLHVSNNEDDICKLSSELKKL